jgi:protein-S-isoprenylcysteine O-methyltransferase Ste14
MISGFIEFLVKQSKREHSIIIRILAVFLGLILFIAVIPAFILWLGRIFNPGLLLPASLAQVISLICFIIGLPWMLSAVFWQLFRGKGTPVPLIPTKHFLQNGPYKYVRNPMIMGFFLYLLGWAFLSNHLLSFLAASLIIALLLMEIKFIEEPELTKRFGNAYLEYKKEVPFMFPKLSRVK